MTSLIKMLTDWFREAFTANLGLKLLAMTFALGLFAYQRGQEDQQQRTIPVGVVMRLPPDSAKRELKLALYHDGNDNAELEERIDAIDLAMFAMGD